MTVSSGALQIGALAKLHAEVEHLTPALKRLAAAVLARPREVIYQSITELAEEAKVGEASVIRLCRDLGFKGFQDFKLALAADLAVRPEKREPHAANSLPELLERATQEASLALRETCASLDPVVLEVAVGALLGAEVVLVYGAGASGVTAGDFAYKLLRLGYHILAPTDAHLAAMTAATLPAAAVVIGLTRSGSTLDTLKVLELARSRGVTTVVVSQRLKSPAAALADITLYTASSESPLTGGSVASKMGQLLLLDVLYASLLLRKENAQQYVTGTAQAVTDRNP